MSSGTPSKSSTPPNVKRFRVVQPWGRRKAVEHTLLSEHWTAGEAFAEIDRLSAEMARSGEPSDAIELLVITADGCMVFRRDFY